MDRLDKLLYPLQEGEGEPGSKGGGGTPPAPKEPPKGGEPPKGDPPPAGDKTVPVDVLPEELRDRPAAEVKFLLGHMVTAVRERGKEVDDLKTQIAELRGAVGAQPKPEPKPDPNADKPLEELILEDTPAAIERYLRDKGYVGSVEDLAAEVGEAVFASMSAQIDDFEEYEDDVRAILKEGKLRASKKNIIGAYTMAVGQRALSDKTRAGRKGTGSIPPGAPPPEPPKPEGAKLSDLETEVMRAHGFNDPEEWIKYRDNPPELKLKTS